MLKVKVQLGIGKSDLEPGAYKLSVLLVEKETTGGREYDQMSAFDNVASHTYYGHGNPIQGYVHPNRLLDVLTDNPFGELIETEHLKARQLSSYQFVADVSEIDSDLRVVAFLEEVDPTTEIHGILNCQFTDAGMQIGFE